MGKPMGFLVCPIHFGETGFKFFPSEGLQTRPEAYALFVNQLTQPRRSLPMNKSLTKIVNRHAYKLTDAESIFPIIVLGAVTFAFVSDNPAGYIARQIVLLPLTLILG